MERSDRATWEWVEATFGTCEVVGAVAHDHGYSRLWRLRRGDDYLWLKMHKFAPKWAGEVHALTRWAPRLGLAPAVIGHRADPPAVLLSEVPGVAAEEASLSAEGERRMWGEAGDWLRRLHEIEGEGLGGVQLDGTPNGEPSRDPEAFVRKTFDQRIREGVEMALLDRAELDFVANGMREWLPALAGERPRAIHRDFSPRNWMVGGGGELTGVIDFEHARWDVRAADLNRWWDYEFLREPGLAAAFFGAYGRLDDRLAAQIQALRLLQAAGTIVWATKVGDSAYAARNREALHRMMDDPRLPGEGG